MSKTTKHLLRKQGDSEYSYALLVPEEEHNKIAVFDTHGGLATSEYHPDGLCNSVTDAILYIEYLSDLQNLPRKAFSYRPVHYVPATITYEK